MAEQDDRRGFLARISTWFMLGGLAAGYGALAAAAARFLYPARERRLRWQYVARLADLAPGDSRDFRAPSGETIAVARRAASGTADDFVALSSTCPHLGCQVHWERQNARFFCPCHNGAFDPEGEPTAGPPKEAGQRLSRYPLEVRGGMLFVQLPVDHLTSNGARRA